MKASVFFLVVGVLVIDQHAAIAKTISELQTKTENRLINGIKMGFQMCEATFPGQTPTAWEKLREFIFPITFGEFETQFREFGTFKGFTNSIYEKYVFLNPGVPIQLREEASILFMSSSPVSEPGGIYRYAVYRQGSNLLSGSIPESKIQQAFAAADRQIPPPPPAPSAIDPLQEAAQAKMLRNLEEVQAEFLREHPEVLRGEMPRERKIQPAKKAKSVHSNFPVLPSETNSTSGAVAVTDAPILNHWWVLLAVLVAGAILFLLLRRGKAP